jgi:phosphoglycerate dehydrogenase-like enzyme
MAFKLLILRSAERPETHVADGWPALLAAALPDVEVRFARSEAEAMPLIEDADAAFGAIGPELFSRAKRLRWVACPQAGPDPSFYHRRLVESDVAVTNTRGIYNDHISAHILAWVLTFARGLHRYQAQQARHEWRRGHPVVYLPEATALIVGVGGIGTETARLCAAFGMTVLGVDPRLTAPPPGVAELHPPERLAELLPRADFVILTAPETPATQGLFNAHLFRRMRRSAFFINIGRGATVVLDDLNAALREGKLAGAALDVFQIEPLPPAHPLWDAPGMLITPHVAVDGPHTDERRTALFLENCRRFHAGRPLLNVVDKANWF